MMVYLHSTQLIALLNVANLQFFHSMKTNILVNSSFCHQVTSTVVFYRTSKCLKSEKTSIYSWSSEFEYCYCVVRHLEENQFSGEIPSSLGNISSLKEV